MEKPCLHCAMVKNPDDCKYKNCPLYRAWFIDAWEKIRTMFSKNT